MNKFELLLIESLMKSRIECPEKLVVMALQGISVKRQKYHDRWLNSALKRLNHFEGSNGFESLDEFIHLTYDDAVKADIPFEDYIRLIDVYRIECLENTSVEPKNASFFAPEFAIDRLCFILEGCYFNENGTPVLNGILKRFKKKHAIGLLLLLIHDVPNGVKVDKSLRISNITRLELSYLGLEEIPYLDKLFNLSILNCSCNEITELNLVSNKKLLVLDCSENHLQYLDVRENRRLEMLICDENHLSHLNVYNNKELVHLSCSSNEIMELNISENPELISIICFCNELNELNTTENKFIEFIDCAYNHIEDLDVTKNVNLEGLNVEGNSLNSLNLKSNKLLTSLNIIDNEISEIDTSQNSLLTDIKKYKNARTR